jgi:CBS domain containing-hemolysin-like protein
MMAYRLLILLVILATNGFFAAAEVSLVSVRKSRLRSLADQGQVGAQAALNLLANPARLLSLTQVGVTLASLGLGWAGEETIYELILRFAHPLIQPGTAWMFHSGGIIVAFLLISYGHVVIGEVVPKNLALEKADRLALLVAPPLLIFGRISAPFVFVAERSARALSKLIGLSGDQSGGGHSPEELKFVVSLSHEEGHIRRFEEDAILALLDLKEYYVREIMVPRNQIVSISLEANLDQVLRLMSANEFSRLPVYDKTPETIVGYLHYKDLMEVWEQRRAAQEKRKLPRSFRVRQILRRLPIVPETKVLTDLIDEFRNTHRHMALVVDEFGTIAGLVTLEDILEQIFGEIGDEHDAKRPAHKAETPVVELDGSTSIRDLDAQYGIELPGDAGFETLAGFILYELGYIPKEGEEVVYGGRRYIVLSMERNRIATVRIEKITPLPGDEASSLGV